MPGGGLVFAPSGQIGGIDYEVLNDGATKRNAVGQGPARDIVYMVRHEESDAFLDALMGSITPVGVGGTYLFVPGHAYPGNTNIVCVAVDCEGMGLPQPDPKLIKYDWARVTAHYESPRYSFESPELSYPEFESASGGLPYTVSQRSHTTEESVPESAQVFKVAAPDDVTPVKKSKVVVIRTEITITFFGVPFLPVGLPNTLAGRLNSTTLFGFPKGQVRYEGQDCQPDNNPDGSHCYTVRRTFTTQDHDFNAEWHPTPGLGWVVLWDGSSLYTHGYSNLLPVLQP